MRWGPGIERPSLIGRASWRLRAALAAAALLGCGTAAAQVLISPVVVEFGPKQKIATVRITLSEKASRPMRLQAQLLRWRQDVHGSAVTEPSEDLVVTPRIADLQPGRQQVLRLALRGALPAPAEMAYRLVLEDIAEQAPVDMGGGAAVTFRMAYDLPVMVAPRGPVVQALRWRDCPTTAPRLQGGACVRLLNAGNRRVKVQAITLVGDGWQQALTLGEGQAVLSGAEREWTIPARSAGPVRTVQVRTSRGQLLQAEPAGS